MTMLRRLLPRCLLFLVTGCSWAYGQKKGGEKKWVGDTATVTIVLGGSGPMVVDEVTESGDGYWYKRGNISTFIDRARVVRVEYPKPAAETAAPEPAESTG